MASTFALFVLVVAACAVTAIESRALPNAAPLPMVMDAFGNPVMIVRDKRASYYPYPRRTMMFTGFYRPTRNSAAGNQASGVYTQGSTVGGGTYLEQPQYLRDGPEPADEPEISRADAEAAPEFIPEDDESQREHEQPQNDQPQNERPQQDQPQYDQPQNDQSQDEQPADNAADQPQDDQEKEAEKPANDQESLEPAQPVHRPVHKPAANHPKKNKKVTTPAPHDEDEEDDDYEDEEPISVFVPKPGKGRKNYPSLNNFFPMVFSFPRGTSRDGSAGAGSPPGMITAIANSYSTGKGGVASSVATAYGGSPTKKPKRPTSENI